MRATSWFFVAWIALFGCGSGSRSGADGGTATPPPAKPNPLDVAASVRPELAVHAVVTPDGGISTLRAADPDNQVTFTLTIPEGAVDSPHAVTLQPVQKIDKLPYSGGLIGAVQIEPEGLNLWGAATLTIESTAPIDPAQVSGFAYHGSGKEFHLARARVQDGKIVIALQHFSGHGAGRRRASDDALLAPLVPTEPRDQLEQREGDAADRSRRGETVDPMKTANAAYGAVASAIDFALAPKASTDSLIEAVNTFQQWQHQLSNDKIAGNFAQELRDDAARLSQAVKARLDALSAVCSAHDWPSIAELRHLGLAAYRASSFQNGGDEPGALAAHIDPKDVVAKMDRCLRFDLAFTSTVKFDGSSAGLGKGAWAVSSHVAIRLPPGDPHVALLGSDALAYDVDELSMQIMFLNLACTWRDVANKPGELWVSLLLEKEGPELMLAPGSQPPTEIGQIDCSPVGGSSTAEAHSWLEDWEALHSDLMFRQDDTGDLAPLVRFFDFAPSVWTRTAPGVYEANPPANDPLGNNGVRTDTTHVQFKHVPQ